jgi:general stress protein CsbA
MARIPWYLKYWKPLWFAIAFPIGGIYLFANFDLSRTVWFVLALVLTIGAVMFDKYVTNLKQRDQDEGATRP